MIMPASLLSENCFLRQLLLLDVPATYHSFCWHSMRSERCLNQIRAHLTRYERIALLVSDFAVAAGAAVAVLLELEFSSAPSASIVSNLDSTPATACCRNVPHRDDCLVGAAIALYCSLFSEERVASFKVAPNPHQIHDIRSRPRGPQRSFRAGSRRARNALHWKQGSA